MKTVFSSAVRHVDTARPALPVVTRAAGTVGSSAAGTNAVMNGLLPIRASDSNQQTQIRRLWQSAHKSTALAGLTGAQFRLSFQSEEVYLPSKIIPPQKFDADLLSYSPRRPLQIDLNEAYADREITGEPITEKILLKDQMANNLKSASRPVKVFDFYGHGTTAYALLMMLNFTNGKLIGRKILTQDTGLPVPQGERNPYDNDSEHVSVVNLGYGFSTGLNQVYARIMTAPDRLLTSPEAQKKLKTRHQKYQEWGPDHPARDDKADVEALMNFSGMLADHPEQKRLYDICSQIRIISFGDAHNDLECHHEKRDVEYGLVEELTTRFVTCAEEYVDSLRHVTSLFDSDIQVYPSTVLKQIDTTRTYRERRELFLKLSAG